MHAVSVSDADPGSQFFPSRIPDLNSFIPDPGYASQNLSILTQKSVSKLIWSGYLIPDQDPGSWDFTHPGFRGQKGTGSRIRICNTGFCEPLPWRGRFHRPALGEEEPFCRLPSLLLGGLELWTWQAVRRSWKALRCPEHSWSFCSHKTYLCAICKYVNRVPVCN